MDENQTAPHDALGALPWIVGVPKPSFADDPWFQRFCRVAADIMMEYADNERGSENRGGVE